MPNFKNFLSLLKLIFVLNDKPVLAILLVSMTGFAVAALALYVVLVALKGTV
jgi:hypothetical protein